MSIATADLARTFGEKIAENQLQLPAMPGTAAQVLTLCQQEETDAARLSSVIHKDQAIASNVLRVANSAAYAGQVPCSSLQQAVGRLGLQLVTEIAMAVAVRGRMFGNPACADLLAELWKHSVLTAFFTKEIARLRRRNVETAFLAGLLHDIGKAVLLDSVDRLVGKRALRVLVPDLLAAVDEQHIAAGHMLALAWKLPDQITEAIDHHHDWQAAERFADMAATVCLADLIANHVAPGQFYGESTLEELQAHPVLVGLNVYADQLDELLGRRDQAMLVAEGMQ